MLLVLLSLAAAPLPAAALPAAPPAKDCRTVEVRQAAGTPGRFVPLGTLPPGNLYLALDRRIDRCLVPVTVATTIPAANGVDAR